MKSYNNTAFNNTIQPVDNWTLYEINWSAEKICIVSMYSIIFIFAVSGNVLVIVTLTLNKRMRTVTNVFLMNLAVSDLLLGVFCMPFTLVGSLLRNFIFGDVMCRLIPYLQAVSVSVSVWTLVSISLERYFAICRPFTSRQWQTISHSYKVVVWVWVGSLLTMLPIAVLSRLLPTKLPNRYKCRDVWPNVTLERVFNLYLDGVLLVVPLLIMIVMYSLIIHTLYTGLHREIEAFPLRFLANRSQDLPTNRNTRRKTVVLQTTEDKRYSTFSLTSRSRMMVQRHLVIKGNYNKGRVAKKRIIRMLFVIVMNFFICWAPLFVINTWALYDPKAIYRKLPPTAISVIHLMAYFSSSCNPVIYFFMHSKYRQALMSIFSCRRRRRWRSSRWTKKSVTLNSMCSVRAVSAHNNPATGLESHSLREVETPDLL